MNLSTTLVVTKGSTNPKVLPSELQTLIGMPLTLTVNIKPHETLGVNNATRSQTMVPPTPDLKSKAAKRASTSETEKETPVTAEEPPAPAPAAGNDKRPSPKEDESTEEEQLPTDIASKTIDRQLSRSRVDALMVQH
ncbi:hypothetical protein QVD17_25936 [Tagetes erecta]|uniref:Uncharacterized protein n=1 Tax=Tagetes erecta TaxID=13708 RepID=A0AAD8K6J5_TARER|nr:hypothetical protein QVD17_25936 [Tagetes erecta]